MQIFFLQPVFLMLLFQVTSFIHLEQERHELSLPPHQRRDHETFWGRSERGRSSGWRGSDARNEGWWSGASGWSSSGWAWGDQSNEWDWGSWEYQ